MRRKGWIGAAVAAAVLSCTMGVAYAHDQGLPPYAYVVKAEPAPVYYRCGVASSTLMESGSSSATAGATTTSRSAAFCANTYNVAAGNLASNHILYYKSGSSWLLCNSKNVTLDHTDYTVNSIQTTGYCGHVLHRVGGFHRIYIDGDPYDYWSTSSDHQF